MFIEKPLLDLLGKIWIIVQAGSLHFCLHEIIIFIKICIFYNFKL